MAFELRSCAATVACALVFCGVAAPQTARPDQRMSVEQIASRLGEMNEARRVALRKDESRRVMTVTYQGPLGAGEAAETVLMTFTAPESKQFTVLSSSGAQVIRDSVFQRALTAEQRWP